MELPGGGLCGAVSLQIFIPAIVVGFLSRLICTRIHDQVHILPIAMGTAAAVYDQLFVQVIIVVEHLLQLILQLGIAGAAAGGKAAVGDQVGICHHLSDSNCADILPAVAANHTVQTGPGILGGKGRVLCIVVIRQMLPGQEGSVGDIVVDPRGVIDLRIELHPVVVAPVTVASSIEICIGAIQNIVITIARVIDPAADGWAAQIIIGHIGRSLRSQVRRQLGICRAAEGGGARIGHRTGLHIVVIGKGGNIQRKALNVLRRTAAAIGQLYMDGIGDIGILVAGVVDRIRHRIRAQEAQLCLYLAQCSPNGSGSNTVSVGYNVTRSGGDKLRQVLPRFIQCCIGDAQTEHRAVAIAIGSGDRLILLIDPDTHGRIGGNGQIRIGKQYSLLLFAVFPVLALFRRGAFAFSRFCILCGLLCHLLPGHIGLPVIGGGTAGVAGETKAVALCNRICGIRSNGKADAAAGHIGNGIGLAGRQVFADGSAILEGARNIDLLFHPGKEHLQLIVVLGAVNAAVGIDLPLNVKELCGNRRVQELIALCILLCRHQLFGQGAHIIGNILLNTDAFIVGRNVLHIKLHIQGSAAIHSGPLCIELILLHCRIVGADDPVRTVIQGRIHFRLALCILFKNGLQGSFCFWKLADIRFLKRCLQRFIKA